MNTQRPHLMYTLTITAGLLLPLLLLEGIMRLLPVTDAANTPPVNQNNPIIHFMPNQEITFSRGWRFSISNVKRINNYGYTSDYDYHRATVNDSPLLTIIGDSYVEAAQVENKQSMHGLLASRFEGRGRIYALGYSGAPLSQYLAFADFARNEFEPDAMAFVIIGNDFDESLLKYKSAPGFYYFTDESSGTMTLKLVNYDGSSMLRKYTKKSAFIRYLFLTAGVNLDTMKAILNPEKSAWQRDFVGNTDTNADQVRLQDSRAAVNAFFDQLPEKSGLPADRVLFIVDGMRPHLYTSDGMEIAEESYFDIMRRYFLDRASGLGYQVIDMHTVFEKHYRQHSERFEFPTDAHWNELGHKLVADEIESSHTLRSIFLP
jgi:hypothetical protein